MTCHFGKCFWSLQTLKSGHWSLQVMYHLARATIVAELHEPRSTKYGLKVRRNEQYSCFYLQFHLYCISARKPLILEFSSICASIAQRQSTGLVARGREFNPHWRQENTINVRHSRAHFNNNRFWTHLGAF